MKKSSIIIFILAAIFFSCGEQPTETNKEPTTTEDKFAGKRSEENVDYVANMVTRISQRVELSEEQVDSIKKIGSEFNFNNLSQEEYLKTRNAFKDKIFQEVLTEEQRSKLPGSK